VSEIKLYHEAAVTEAEYPGDADTLAWWKFNEPAGTFPHSVHNYGTTGNANDLTLFDVGNPLELQQGVPGPYSPVMGVDGRAFRTYAAGAVALEPVAPLTVDVMVIPSRFSGAVECLIYKEYDAAGPWDPPFTSLSMLLNNTSGSWQVTMTTAGVRTIWTIDALCNLSQGTPQHLGFTWDGTTVRFYANGMKSGQEQAFAGPIDYGTHGPWTMLGTFNPSAPFEALEGKFWNARVHQVAMPLSYFQGVYRALMGWTDNPLPTP
jgi:hypothetical protein